ncbi:MAG: GNAT family N-acetyltransferase [Planctomycetota bacterium]|nr:GNAT family N-acetyltransferase [Planctomycetota bacterium]
MPAPDAAGKPVRMSRSTLRDLPVFPLPPGYTLRWFEPEDRARWTLLQRAADTLQPIPETLFEEQFGSDAAEWRRRICLLCGPDGREVGAAAAWFGSASAGRDWGRIHWVAVHPSCQGQGLSKPLISAVCARLAELGHARAYLTTSTARVPAIRLYLKFGFAPDEQNEEDRRAWAEIRESLR